MDASSALAAALKPFDRPLWHTSWAFSSVRLCLSLSYAALNQSRGPWPLCPCSRLHLCILLNLAGTELSLAVIFVRRGTSSSAVPRGEGSQVLRLRVPRIVSTRVPLRVSTGSRVLYGLISSPPIFDLWHQVLAIVGLFGVWAQARSTQVAATMMARQREFAAARGRRR